MHDDFDEIDMKRQAEDNQSFNRHVVDELVNKSKLEQEARNQRLRFVFGWGRNSKEGNESINPALQASEQQKESNRPNEAQQQATQTSRQDSPGGPGTKIFVSVVVVIIVVILVVAICYKVVAFLGG